MNQIRPIFELLKLTDDLIIPEFIFSISNTTNTSAPTGKAEDGLSVSKESGGDAEFLVEVLKDDGYVILNIGFCNCFHARVKKEKEGIDNSHKDLLNDYYQNLQSQQLEHSNNTSLADSDDEEEELNEVASNAILAKDLQDEEESDEEEFEQV